MMQNSVSAGGPIIEPAEGFLKIIEKESHQPVARCFQCQKCSAGCPVAPIADLHTSEVIRLVQVGEIERLLTSSRLWLCLSCKTCQARCPNGIDTSEVIDVLKRMVISQKRVPGETKIPAFHRSFMDTVERTGRLYDLGMIGLYKIRTGTFLADMGLGMSMIRRGKLKFLPERVKGLEQVRKIFRMGRDKQ